MLRFLKSIRAKLILWYSFVLLTTLATFGIIAYTYSSQKLAENLDRSLSNEVRWVKTFIEGKISKLKPSRRFTYSNKKQIPLPPVALGDLAIANQGGADDEVWNQIYQHALLNPKKTLIEVTNKYGAIVFRSFSTEDESLAVGDVPLNTIKIQTLRTNKGTELRAAATTTSDLEISVAYPLSELKEALDNLFSIFLILIPAALVVSIGGGWFLASQSLKPVDEVTRAAQEISAQNLDRQIPTRQVNDEIGRLILTFNDMIARLRHSFDQIRQFSMDASHELRTPLTIIRGEVELALRSPKQPEEYRRILVSTMEEIVRLSTIIENLLTLSKAELGQHVVLYEEEVNMKDLVNDLFEDGEMLAAKKHISVELRKNEDLSVMGDRVRLKQLFLNLIDNAIKYTPEHGKVKLSSERDDGYVRVQIQDTGMGIPENEQAKIFDRFYRVDKARTREFGGSGLGLSIAKWIADHHRGRIEVKSKENEGSIFSVYLPL